MGKGFDCATPISRSTAERFKNDGYVFVCRYLIPSGWKRLTPEEAKAISEAGLYIVSVFETTANRAVNGRNAGLEDGAAALRVAREVGQPEGTAIYFAVDYDAQSGDYNRIEAYLRAAAEQLPGYETGVYGSYAVVEAMAARGACSKFWQTYAWSRGNKSDSSNIYQYQNDIQVNGIQIDLDESYGNEGWWTLRESSGQPVLSSEDAKKIIPFLSAAYFATEVPAARNEFHRLANELREAAGLEEES